MDDFIDIRILSEMNSPELDLGLPGTITVITNNSQTQDALSNIEDVLSGIDKSEKYLQYRMNIISTDKLTDRNDDWNLICPIQDPISKSSLFVACLADLEDLDLAVYAVINESEAMMRRMVEDALITVAYKDPMGFKESVTSAIEDDSDNLFPTSETALYKASEVLPSPESSDESTSCSAFSDDNEDKGIDDFYYHEAAVGAEKYTQNPRLHQISHGDRQRAFNNIPDRISNSFFKDNPEDAFIVSQTFANMTPEEQLAIIYAYAKTHRNALRDLHKISLSGGFKYELILKAWEPKYNRVFKNKYQYCLFIKDRRGRETPVLFKHNPSFCIYAMYMIDRYKRKDNVTDLEIKKMRKAFTSTYKILIDEDEEKINSLFTNMNLREINGKLREGRYAEYIKDIHQTFENILDDVNVIPFKVGFGRYLQVPPEKLTIPKKLTDLLIATDYK